MKVKIFSIAAVLAITISCVYVYSQSQLKLKNKPIENELLVEILNDSQMKELAPPLPKHSNLFLRLYSIEEFGTWTRARNSDFLMTVFLKPKLA